MGDPTATAAIGRTLQVRSLFSKYEVVGEQIVSDFVSSIPENFSDAVNIILTHAEDVSTNDFILNNRRKLQILIDKFHREAGTMTAGVTNKIRSLVDPETQIFVSIHQPNLFAYGGVFKKIVLLQTLMRAVEKRTSRNKFVNLFLIVDHDFMDDAYIRLAELPSIKHSGGRLELRMPVSESRRWQLVCNMPLPGRTILDRWRMQIYSWVRSSFSSVYSKSDRSMILDNFEHFWRKVEESYSRSKSYSDFNSFLISELVNAEWGYDTLFVRLSEMSTVFEDGFKYLISNFMKYSNVLNKTENMFFRCGVDTGVSPSSYLNAPLWVHCRCGSKASARVRGNQQEQISLEGTCMSCKKAIEVILGNQNDLTIPKDMLNGLSPRAIPILLLLSRDLGITCYASGTGGSMGYTMVGAMVFKELSIKMPVTLVWASTDVYRGLAQAEALELLPLSKEADISHYVEILKQKNSNFKSKIDPLIAERAILIRTGGSLDSVLSNLFRLKQGQRKIRQLIKVAEKVKNATETKPSIIDYAINFGVGNTEMLWRRNLLKNDSLSAAIAMSP
ncbi:MAG TPA: hypothetical protein VFI73_06285 [Candidatus Nitrosopolaris sp.]|nr:hypothetical protein [Candidatus Nitrosopolaris sp.]